MTLYLSGNGCGNGFAFRPFRTDLLHCCHAAADNDRPTLSVCILRSALERQHPARTVTETVSGCRVMLVREPGRQPFKSSPRLLQSQLVQVYGGGRRGLVPQNRLYHRHGLPHLVQDGCRQVPDGVEAERLHFRPAAQLRHEMEALLERLSVLVPAESRIVLAYEHILGIRERAVLPPPA